MKLEHFIILAAGKIKFHAEIAHSLNDDKEHAAFEFDSIAAIADALENCILANESELREMASKLNLVKLFNDMLNDQVTDSENIYAKVALIYK